MEHQAAEDMTKEPVLSNAAPVLGLMNGVPVFEKVGGHGISLLFFEQISVGSISNHITTAFAQLYINFN